MSSDRQLNYVNDLQNRDQKLYYVDDASELNSVNLEENDKIYAINDNKLFQMEIADQEQELSGDVVSFNGRNNTKIKSLIVNIEPIQDLHGMSNPYPAGASVNLIPDMTDTSNGYVAGYYLNTDGSTTANTNYYISEYIKLDSAATYTWSNRVNTTIDPSICFYDENRDYISGIAINKQYSHTFTPPEGAVYARSSQTTYAYQEAASTNPALQLEVGSTATPYKRYSNICPISGWSQGIVYNDPVYGGLVNWNQIRRNSTSSHTADGITTSYNENTHLVSVRNNSRTSEYSSGSTQVILSTVAPINGHRYAFLGPKEIGVEIIVMDGGTSGPQAQVGSILNYSWSKSGDKFRLRITSKYNFVNAHPIGDIYSFYLNIIDITKLFGEEKAATVTYDEIAAMFPYDWYPYNEGEVTTVSAVNNNPYGAIPITFTNSSMSDPMTVYGGTVTLNADESADVVVKIVKAFPTYEYFNSLEHGSAANNSCYFRNFAYYTNAIITYRNRNRRAGGYYARSNILNVRAFNNTAVANSQNRLYFYYPEGVTNITEFMDFLKNIYDSGNVVEIVYEPTDILTYHFDNVGQLYTFLGTNNVWSDIGDITVKIVEKGITAFELKPYT